MKLVSQFAATMVLNSHNASEYVHGSKDYSTLHDRHTGQGSWSWTPSDFELPMTAYLELHAGGDWMVLKTNTLRRDGLVWVRDERGEQSVQFVDPIDGPHSLLAFSVHLSSRKSCELLRTQPLCPNPGCV